LFNKQTNISTINKDKNILVTRFHPTDDNLREIVNKNWDLLGKNAKTNFLHKNKPTVGYRRPPNLRDILVKAEIRSKREITSQKLIEKNKNNPKVQINQIQFPATNQLVTNEKT
jgi:hypothetical protein